MSVEQANTVFLPNNFATERSLEHAQKIALQLRSAKVQESHLFIATIATGQLDYLFRRLDFSAAEVIDKAYSCLKKNVSEPEGDILYSDHVQQLLMKAQKFAREEGFAEVFPVNVLAACLEDSNSFSNNTIRRFGVEDPHIILSGGY